MSSYCDESSTHSLLAKRLRCLAFVVCCMQFDKEVHMWTEYVYYLCGEGYACKLRMDKKRLQICQLAEWFVTGECMNRFKDGQYWEAEGRKTLNRITDVCRLHFDLLRSPTLTLLGFFSCKNSYVNLLLSLTHIHKQMLKCKCQIFIYM